MITIGIGTRVIYTPVTAEHPMTPQPAAAIITAWDEQKQTATLAVFFPNTDFLTPKKNVIEGTGPGCFQQLQLK